MPGHLIRPVSFSGRVTTRTCLSSLVVKTCSLKDLLCLVDLKSEDMQPHGVVIACSLVGLKNLPKRPTAHRHRELSDGTALDTAMYCPQVLPIYFGTGIPACIDNDGGAPKRSVSDLAIAHARAHARGAATCTLAPSVISQGSCRQCSGGGGSGLGLVLLESGPERTQLFSAEAHTHFVHQLGVDHQVHQRHLCDSKVVEQIHKGRVTSIELCKQDVWLLFRNRFDFWVQRLAHIAFTCEEVCN